MSTWIYSSDVCACGRPKKKSSAHCSFCDAAQPAPGLERKYKRCPICGGWMSPKAKKCRRCVVPERDAAELQHKRPWHGNEPDYSEVPEDFLRAFAGFFMGEGCVRIKKNPYSLVVDIGLHEVDRDVLLLCQHYLGGSFQEFPKKHQVNWRLQGIRNVAALMRLVERYAGSLQCAKMQDVRLALEYADFRLRLPHHLSAEQKTAVEQWRSRMSIVKVRA